MPQDGTGDIASARAGRYVRQLTGYRAFVPKPLPPDPPLRWSEELLQALSEADRALGRLVGLARSLPNPDLFVAMYVRREAVLSSQIEGTQSSLDDLLAFEMDAPGATPPADITETVNYVRAMNLGLRLLHDLPLSGRLIRAVHRELLTGVRGSEAIPGSSGAPRTGSDRPDARCRTPRSSRPHRGISPMRSGRSSGSCTTAPCHRWYWPAWCTHSSRRSTRSPTVTAGWGAC